MSYTARDARVELLEQVAQAIDEIAAALAALGGAYELLDETTGDALEEALFRPAQRAYGRAQRTHAAFAARHGLPERSFAAASSGLPSQGVAAFVQSAADDAERADQLLAELQDSLLPVEVGDAELRAGLAEVRTLIAALPRAARDFQRTLGR